MKKVTLLICLFISVNIFAQPFSLIKEINTTATSGSLGAAMMQRVGTTVYFVANNGINGNELWKTDGTAAGTLMVKDINPGAGSTGFINFTTGDGLLFFAADDGVHGFEMWRSDGTEAGTFMLYDGFSGCTFCENRLFFHNGYLYFAGDDGTTGAELWKTDGTVAGTVLVKDIFPGPTMSHPAPTSGVNYTFVALGNDIYFTAMDAAGGRELFKSDGTAAGTVMIKDVFPGATSGISTVNHKAAVFNGKVYFVANDGPGGAELWATDGTDAGTYRVKDIVAGSGSSQPNNLIAFNGALYFTASSINNAIPDLWKTDGTDAGTVLVRNLVADGITLTIGNSAVVDQFTVANGKLFFRGTGPNGLELYATDGTTAGTGIVKDIYSGINSTSPNGLFAFNNNLYFQAIDAEMPSRGGALYKSDGTAAGTMMIMDGESGGSLAMPAVTMTSAGGRLFFWGNTGEHGSELWSTDGTNANTALVKDIVTTKIGTPNSGSSVFGSIVFNGYYYYAAVDDTHGNELWKSNGTTAGTVMVKDIWPGKAPSNPTQLFVYGGAIYFTASEGVNGTELWKTDGTEAGTVMVADINPGPVNSSPNRFFISNNYLYFSAYHPSYGSEFWRTDGTASGTNLVLDLLTGPANGAAGFSDVVTLNNIGYVIMNIPAGNVLSLPSGNRLIKVDGVSNTISDFAPVITNGTDLGIVGSTLYITGRNASNQTLLWKSENGAAVTQVKILSTTSTNAYQLTNCGGKLYFAASNGAAAGMEPWISDGTDAGTFMFKDINPGTNSSTPNQFIFSGSKVYFTASSTGNTNGEFELWATDGTTAGTYLVKDILSGSTGSRPNSTISAFGNKVLFTANDGTTGYELWQSDGTAAGTFLLQEFNTSGDGVVPALSIFFNFPVDFVYSKLDDKIVFFARSADKGLQLYSGSIASPYKYVNDNSTTNDVFTTAIGNNANNGSQSSPYATVSYAVSQAQAGDTIYVDAGVFVEQVTLDKGITLIGAGSGVTIIWKPAVTNPPPGPFSEQGTIQTAQNIGDVHIRDMSVTGDGSVGVTPIILQTGGSVKNCRLIGGSQGIFFRVDPAIKTALIENNYISVEYIGINCQGSGLSVSLINNTIELTNPFFAAGVFAGLDFGPLVRFTATGNIIRNYNAQGMLANSYNTNITQNSFTGTGAHAIEQSTNSLGIATCNWYGTADAATIASKVSGLFSYTPFLTNGTNTNTTTYGNYSFVPVVGSCGEGGNSFYVNDNNLTGNIFTTAVGNNINNGTSAAPLATINEALARAVAGDIIYVDAGTYSEIVNVSKNITIRGAGMGITILNGPSGPVIPLPGTGETGIIQTVSGLTNVIIESITIDGTTSDEAHGIFIQGGGRVSNCELRYVNDGIYFQYISAELRTAISNNNFVHHINYVGSLFAGNGLSVTATNNVIDLTGAIGGMGFIAGYGGSGNLASFTATNNSIINFTSFGMMVGSLQTAQVHNNSITRISGNFLQSANININATCNWYGTADAAAIIPNMSGANYISWLTNGTDNSTAIGFQSLPGVCNGRQNKFYVNDNSLTGDVFSTGANPVGNDANPGIPSAPLLTLNAALTKASAGDSIFVDAGTYNLTTQLTINKAITILGTNYNISPNDAVNKYQLNASRNTESNFTGLNFSIAADNVIIKGLQLTPSSTALTSFNENSHVTLEKNIFNVVGTVNALDFQGISSTPILKTDINLADNRFNRTDNLGGNSVVAGKVKNVLMDNNVFIQPQYTSSGAAFRGVIGFGLENIVISNNNLKFVGNGIAPFHMQDSYITGNKFDSCGNGVFLQPFNLASSNVNINANTFYNSRLGRDVMLRGGSGGSLTNLNINNNIINQEVNGVNSIVGLIQLECNVNNNYGTISVANNIINISGDYNFNGVLGHNGIILAGKHSNTTVSGNELNFSAIHTVRGPGNILPPFPTGIFINTDGGNGNNGLIPAGAIINITNNKINGFKESIGIYDPNPTGVTTSFGYGYLTAGAQVNINNNSFTNDSMSIDNGTQSQSVNASCNWYGSASAQNLINKLTLPTVDIAPWLTNGTDNDAATRFQPVPGSCDGYPTLITLDSYTNVTCNGTANGTINITASYGKAPITYTWVKDGDLNFVSHAEDPTGLAPGIYHLSIVDGNGSNIYVTSTEADGPGTIDVTITEPPVLTAVASGTNVNCFNGTNGTASVTAGGGTAPYTYLWSNGATVSAISNLVAGTYNVTVTDAKGCTKQSSYQVTQPALLTAVATGTSTTCANAATVVANGGTTPYTYLWSNGATTQTISSLPAGTYNVTVTDNKGCTTAASCTVTASEAFNPSASVDNVSCFGAANGKITVTNANGTPPLQYSKDGVNFRSINVFDSLAPNSYTITVRDANGCTGFVTKIITQPILLTVTLGVVQGTCYGQNTGSISAAVSGGTTAYSYQWTGPNGYSSTQLNISNLAGGAYTLTVTDSKGCTAVLPVMVSTFNQITISPVLHHVSCKNGNDGSIILNTAGGSGNFSYSWNTGQTTGSIFNLTQGTNYRVTILDNATQCKRIDTFIIKEPDALTAKDSTTEVLGCTIPGKLYASATGGTSPYQFRFGNSAYQSSAIFTGLSGRTDTLWVKDVNGCIAFKPAVVIVDKGGDEYETCNNYNNNNAKNRSCPISLGPVISARIGKMTDADWFIFTVSSAGSYKITFNHPSPGIVYAVSAGTGNPPALTGSTANSRTYNLSTGTYHVNVSGNSNSDFSLTCYQFSVTNALVTNTVKDPANNEVRLSIDKLNTSVFPNPHRGAFGIKIESPKEGTAIVEIMNSTGQLIAEKRVPVNNGGVSIANFTNMKHSILFYRVIIGNEVRAGKIIGPN